ncbi:hypothetical protein MMC30_003369 [Trapelia coarctata]|nr:hypothetical protein [Trapelia coarctata]
MSLRVYLLILLLYHCLLPIAAKDWISCYYNQPSIEFPADCTAALAMIPNGTEGLAVDPHIAGDGIPPKFIDLHFPPGVRNRNYFLPAAFRSGSCMILVRGVRLPWNQWLKDQVGPPRPPVKAASAMHFIVWPQVRRLATEIVQTCTRKSKPGRGWGGMAHTSSQLGEHTDPGGRWKFRYTVTVRWSQGLRTTDGVKALLRPPGAVFNVYHAPGASARNADNMGPRLLKASEKP